MEKKCTKYFICTTHANGKMYLNDRSNLMFSKYKKKCVGKQHETCTIPCSLRT